MAISIIDDRELWDSTVDQSPYGLLFHKWDFLKIAEKHTGWTLLPYGVYKGKRLLSLFPLFYKRDLLIKSVFSPPPLSCIPYLGPTMNAGYDGLKPSTRESDLQAVVDEVTAAIRKLSPELRLRPDAARVQRHPAVHVERLLGDLAPHLFHRPEAAPGKDPGRLRQEPPVDAQEGRRAAPAAGAGVRCGDVLQHLRQAVRRAGPDLPDRQPRGT